MGEKQLRNRWYCAALAEELGRTPLARQFLNEPVVMYRREDGTPVALVDACCHRRAPLHAGRIEGDNIRCGYHGMLFDSHGVCIGIPGQAKIPGDARVRSYPIIERAGLIWIWMGDANRAEPRLLPDCGPCTDPAWAAIRGYTGVQCAAILLVDNLMDLSHVAWVHTSTIGSAEDINPTLVWERGDDWVRGTRESKDLSPAPSTESFGFKGNRNETKVMTFSPPFNVTVDIKIWDAGYDYGQAPLNMQMLIYNLMTPETDRTCHYFWVLTRNYQIDNEHLDAALRASTVPLLNEDKRILELTQASMALAPATPMIDLAADAGTLMARRLLAELIDRAAP